MNDSFNKHQDIDALLKNIFNPPIKTDLREMFEKRLEDLKLAESSALSIMQIEHRALNGILDGTLKRVDFLALSKLASFLQISTDDVVKMYLKKFEQNYKEDITTTEKKAFILANFDLASLKKVGFINSITDFDEIESKLKSLLGLKSILDYKRPADHVAFSAGIRKPKNELARTNWIDAARTIFAEIDNPHDYDRQALIQYFPEIRWHSTNIQEGLIEVIRHLYKIGVTVIYQSSFKSLHLRGATCAVNDKPCIVLTNYVGFYPTLWFALIHELFHVLFDWEEISRNNYHLSDDDTDILTVKEKEEEADKFAREYLFSKEKTAAIRANINEPRFVKEFASANHVNESFVYVFYASDLGSGNRSAWAKAKKYNPPFDELISRLDNPWDNRIPTKDYVEYLKKKIYI